MFKSHRVSCCPLSPTVGMFATFFGSDMWHLPSGLIKFCLISHLIQYYLSFVSRINSSRHCGVVWWNSVNVLKFTDDKITLDRRWIQNVVYFTETRVTHTWCFKTVLSLCKNDNCKSAFSIVASLLTSVIRFMQSKVRRNKVGRLLQ